MIQLKCLQVVKDLQGKILIAVKINRGIKNYENQIDPKIKTERNRI